jgi:hypothetical protein
VLAIGGMRLPKEAFVNTESGLAPSPTPTWKSTIESNHLLISAKRLPTLCLGFSLSSNGCQTFVTRGSTNASSSGQNQLPLLSRLLTLTDLERCKTELVAENALLRKPLISLHRVVKQPF